MSVHDFLRDLGLDPESDEVLNDPTLHVSAIASKVVLRVNATTQQDMAPVHIKLSNLNKFQQLLIFDFLGNECQLDPQSLNNITAISVTCAWDDDALRIRPSHIIDDWEIFCEKLLNTFAEDPEIAEKGCKVDLLLHIAE